MDFSTSFTEIQIRCSSLRIQTFHECEKTELIFPVNDARKRINHIQDCFALTLFRLGSFGTLRLEGSLFLFFSVSPLFVAGGFSFSLFLLYLWSNHNQTWHDGTLGQNLSKAIKLLLTPSLGGKYDVIKLFLVSFQVKIRVPLSFVQLS